MAKSIRVTLELVSCKDVERIETIDSKTLSSRPEQFVKDNLLGYYVLINTWLMLIQQWSQYGWVYVLDFIKREGLIALIRGFDEAAAQLIMGEFVDFSLARNIWMDVQSRGTLTGIPSDDELSVHYDPMSAMLLLLRFGKRFSPLRADLLRKSALDGFIETQRSLKYLQRQPDCELINSYVRDTASRFLDWSCAVKALQSVDITDIVFTPGVSYSTKADLVSKLKLTLEERAEYFPLPFGIPVVASSGRSYVEFWGKQMSYEVHTVRLSPVPKSYKAARVIAPEDAVRQALARRYFDVLDPMLPGMIKLHDQSQNQGLARQGSIDGKLATIDLHAASDSLTMTHLWNFLPPEFVKVVQRVLPTHYEVDGKRRLLQSAATMGNSMTFWLESVVFACISLAAVRFYNAWSGEKDETVSVYGDDIIVPTKAAPTVIEWLERIGFVVNVDKSFFDPDRRYRESCGEEYFEGTNVSSRYFPRFPLMGTVGGELSKNALRDSFENTVVDSMAALLDLQHKMFALCQPASLFLTALIREADPKMTKSSPDEALNDIWSYRTEPVITPAPCGSVENGRIRPRQTSETREKHSTLITTSPKQDKRKMSDEDYNSLDMKLVDLYNYLHFLKFGPRYDTPLDELLGVSSPPITLSEARGDVGLKWVLVSKA